MENLSGFAAEMAIYATVCAADGRPTFDEEESGEGRRMVAWQGHSVGFTR